MISKESYRSHFSKPMDADPHSLSIIQGLMQPTKDWVDIQDIVKLTFKAILESMQMQSQSIRDLELAVNSKASKSEVNLCLAQKANISDVTQTMKEIAGNIQARATLEDVQALMEEKVSRSEFQYSIKDKAGLGEMRLAMEKKIDIEIFKDEINNLLRKIDDFKKVINLHAESSATMRDIEEIKKELRHKASIDEVNTRLQQKAGKDSVANALKRKVNINDLEIAFSHKADIKDIESIIKLLDNKADIMKIHEIQSKLQQANIDMKENININNVEKIVTNNITELHKSIAKLDAEIKLQKRFFEKTCEELKIEIERKIDLRDFESMKELLDEKADIKQVGKEINDIKLKTNEAINNSNNRIDGIVNKFGELKLIIEKKIM